MSRNGPIALAYHALFVAFMLAPILVVCFVAFTPEGYLSFPTDRWSLRWFYAIAQYPEFISAFWRSNSPKVRVTRWTFGPPKVGFFRSARPGLASRIFSNSCKRRGCATS